MALPSFPGRAAGFAVGLVVLALGAPAVAQTDPTTTTSPAASTPAPERTVQVLDNIFKPKKLKVAVGTKVTWEWGGVAAHNVVVTKGPQKFKSKTITDGQYSRTITKPGKYLIVCTLHPGMDMVLRARPAPSATTTTAADAATEQGA